MKRNDRLNLHERYGPWAVVTGASDGIGRAFAIDLAARGINLVLVARRGDRLADLATTLQAGGLAETRVVVLDLANPDAGAELNRQTADLDVGLLVAAAGFGTSGNLITGSLPEELAMIDVNCRAVAALAHGFGQRFAARGRGGLILMSSLLAFQGVPGSANYAASKAYVQTFAEGLRVELRPLGVDVIACAPGPIRSGFEARANMRMSVAQTPDVVARATLAAVGRRTTVRPGWLAKVLEGAMTGLPRGGRVGIMGRVMAGMIKHHGRGAKEAA